MIQHTTWQIWIKGRTYGPNFILFMTWYKNPWLKESKAFSKSIAIKIPRQLIGFQISRISSIVRIASKNDHPLMKPFWWVRISKLKTDSNCLANALEAIFTSTVTNETAWSPVQVNDFKLCVCYNSSVSNKLVVWSHLPDVSYA